MSELKKMVRAEEKTKKIIIESCQKCIISHDCKHFKKLKPKEKLMLLCGVGVVGVFHKDCPLEDNQLSKGGE